MRVARIRTIVLLAGFVCLPACSVMDNVKSAATEMTTSAPTAGPYDPPPPSPWQPVPPPKPAAPETFSQPVKINVVADTARPSAGPVPQKPTRAVEPAYTPIQTAPATANAKPNSTPPKGAEKLMTINTGPAIPVHARESSQADQAGVSTQSTETSLIASSGGELIFKGPPRPPPTGPGVLRWILLSLFVGLALAGGVFAYLQVQRKAAIAAAAPPPAEKPPEGFEMKEPAGHSPDTVLEA